MKLSVIICVYNTEYAFFEKCLSSIRESTLAQDEYEICVIDDGSTVDYTELVSKYSLKYKKTENRGIFLARLSGIDMASGEYAIFVDSDDTVSFNYHAPMLKKAVDVGADIVFNDWAFDTERTRYWCHGDSTMTAGVFCEGDEVLLNYSKPRGREHSYFVLWNKLFKTSLLTEARGALQAVADGNPGFNFSEDALITFFAFKSAKRVDTVHTGYYFYRIHDSQSINVISEKRLERQIGCMAITFNTMLENIGDNKYSAEISRNFELWRELISRSHYSYARNNGYTSLYPMIKRAYGVEALKVSTFRDSSAYSDNRPLPSNIAEIDAELLCIWRSDEPVRLSLSGASPYQRRSVEYMRGCGRNIEVARGGARLVKPKIRLWDKLIFNRFVYSVGMLIFKKGSKLRSFLKKHI